jgi:two-component system sensor histidine kinase TctE
MSPTISINARLLVPLSLILTVGAVIMGAAAKQYGKDAVEETYDRLLAGAVLQIAERVSVRDGELLADLPLSAFQLLSLVENDRVFYRVIDPRGRTISGYDALEPPPQWQAQGGITFYYADIRDARVRVAALRRRLVERSLTGTATVLVGQTLAEREALAASIITRALAVIAAVAVLALFLVWLAVRVALGPLRRIEGALLAKDAADLSPLQVQTPRELETVVRAINLFVHRLKTQVQATQSFVADVSHQLRTALTGICTQAEIARGEDDPAVLRRIAERIHRRAVGLGRLSSQILSRAKVIHRADSIPLEHLDLRQVALRAHEDLVLGPETESDIRLELPERLVPVRADPVTLGEALANLLDNARRYGRPPITVQVAVDSAAGVATLAVRDRGPGIPEDQWERAGERFTRMGAGDVESAGLGIAIVNAVAAAHSGRLVIRRPAPGRFEIGVAVPLAGGGS